MPLCSHEFATNIPTISMQHAKSACVERADAVHKCKTYLAVLQCIHHAVCTDAIMLFCSRYCFGTCICSWTGMLCAWGLWFRPLDTHCSAHRQNERKQLSTAIGALHTRQSFVNLCLVLRESQGCNVIIIIIITGIAANRFCQVPTRCA